MSLASSTIASPLSVALRETTASAHERAEKSGFIDDLLQGHSCPAAFTALTIQLEAVYDQFESLLTGHYAGHPLLRAVDDRSLDRTAALSRDVEHLLRGARPGADQLVPATHAYVARLRDDHDPEMMLAHHYVRYLGDLSGGQVIARLVQRHYAVPAAGLSFYRFEGIDAIKPYKDRYRAALDSIVMTADARDRVLARAVEAFELNAAVFADLERSRGARHDAAGVAA